MARLPPADPGTLLSTTHDVGDGLRVRLRLARPGDGLPRGLMFYDPRERYVVVAVTMGGRGEEIVGVADIVLDKTTVADGVRRLLADVGRSLAARSQAA